MLLGLILLWLAGGFLLPAVLPFVGGALVAVLLRPAANFLRRVTGMRYRPAAVAACLLFYGLFGLLICNLGFLLFAQTVALFTRLPELFSASIIPTASGAWEQTMRFMSRFLPSAGVYLEQMSQWLSVLMTQSLSQFSTDVLHSTAAFAARLPGLFFGLFLGILSSFFILMDYDTIAAFLLRQLSPRMKKLVQSSKRFLVTTGKNVVKAYFLLMLLTFCEVSVGLWLLGVEYFAVLGVIVAVVDILPILGSGAVLLPWGLWQIFAGAPQKGIGILLLYGVVVVVRTVAEPKILGDRIGLPPLVTILSMYAGLRLFGALGMILTPMAATLLTHLNTRGLLHMWKGEETS